MPHTVRIHADQTEVSRLVAEWREAGVASEGRDTVFVDDTTGQHWRRTYLGSEYHGGGLPVLITEPVPTVAELLEVVERATVGMRRVRRSVLSTRRSNA